MTPGAACARLRHKQTFVFWGCAVEELGTKERLLEVATELFAARGFAGVSVRDLAGGAGINVATVSYYFGGKEGLYREVVRREVADLDQVIRILESSDDAGLVVQRFARAIASLHGRHPFFASLVHHEILHPSAVFLEIVAPELAQVARNLGLQIDRGRAAGYWRCDLPSHLAAYGLAAMLNYFFLFSPLVTLILPAMASLAASEESTLAEGVFELWSRGMEVRHDT